MGISAPTRSIQYPWLNIQFLQVPRKQSFKPMPSHTCGKSLFVQRLCVFGSKLCKRPAFNLNSVILGIAMIRPPRRPYVTATIALSTFANGRPTCGSLSGNIIREATVVGCDAFMCLNSHELRAASFHLYMGV